MVFFFYGVVDDGVGGVVDVVQSSSKVRQGLGWQVLYLLAFVFFLIFIFFSLFFFFFVGLPFFFLALGCGSLALARCVIASSIDRLCFALPVTPYIIDAVCSSWLSSSHSFTPSIGVV